MPDAAGLAAGLIEPIEQLRGRPRDEVPGGTWSSCRPFGKAVISCRYSAGQPASFGRRTKPFSIIAVCACRRMPLSPCGW